MLKTFAGINYNCPRVFSSAVEVPTVKMLYDVGKREGAECERKSRSILLFFFFNEIAVGK